MQNKWSKVKISILFITLALLSVWCFITQEDETYSQFKENNSTGKIVVAVLPEGLFDNSQDNKIRDDEYNLSFKVFLKGESFFEELLYKGDGIFELDVPEGIYNIVLKSDQGESINYLRGNFDVKQNQTREIKLTPFEGQDVCDEKNGFVMIPDDAGIEDHQIYPKYDKIPTDEPFKAVIKYCQKRRRGNTVIYNFALLTYKNLTISANQVKFNKTKKSLEAIGNRKSPVMIQIDNCVVEKNTVGFSLDSFDPSKFSCNN